MQQAADCGGARTVGWKLEHGESSRVMGELLETDPGLVIDLAADFRVRDPAIRE